MRILPLTFAFALFFVISVRAEEPKMTKIVSVISGPRVARDSAEVKPKTVFLAGKKYARVEEQMNEAGDTQNLIITNEPDCWTINLADKTGRHFVDEGPKFDVHMPILWGADGRPDREFAELEYGEERQFFSPERAKKLEPRKIDGRLCQAFSIMSEENEVVLLLEDKTGKPVQIDRLRDGKLEQSVRYLSYLTSLPFDAALFAPPKNVAITFREGASAKLIYKPTAARTRSITLSATAFARRAPLFKTSSM